MVLVGWTEILVMLCLAYTDTKFTVLRCRKVTLTWDFSQQNPNAMLTVIIL